MSTKDSDSTGKNSITVSNIRMDWDPARGTTRFEGLPVAMMWVDTTLAGLMSGVQAMVGTERYLLALQAEGRKSVEADWQVISAAPDFRRGFEAIANIAAVAGWGHWELSSLDEEARECRFRVTDSWEGRYQKALGVCWGSGMLAGKMAGYCTRLFGTNCWADQTAFIARGAGADEFTVRPSPKRVETEIENLLRADEATRADMAVALRKLEAEVAARTRTETELREAAEQLGVLYEAISDGILVVDAETRRILQANACFCDMLGYSKPELLGKPVDELHPPEVHALIAEQFAALRRGAPHPITEVLFLCKDGTKLLTEVHGNVLTFHGRTCLLGSFRNITERKRYEQQLQRSLAEKETLLRELYHRTKNNMQVIRAMLSLRAARAGSPEVDAIVRETDRRIQAMSMVHQMLYRSQDLSVIDLGQYMGDLATLLMKSHRLTSERIALEVDAGELRTSIDVAIPCGLILNELMSNALRHAFPEGRSGTIRIRLSRSAPDAIEMVFSDDGVGAPPRLVPRAQDSLGFRTIIALTEQQLRGEAAFESGRGVTWRLRFREATDSEGGAS